ncbi:MAG: type II secretion system protein GspD [Erysipelotrichia bacterium]|nr:type II secretion system protein GspD [Erysipelotrichia bacterium]
MKIQQSKTLVCCLSWLIWAGAMQPAVFSQNSQAWQPLRPAIRGAISHPGAPTAGSAFYPVIRKPAKSRNSVSANSTRSPGWVNLGNGARIKVAEAHTSNEPRLSPDVLETIRQLKEEVSEPRYQMAAPSPVTGNTAMSLQPPPAAATTDTTGQKEIGLHETYLKLPADKNIKISSLDFRQTPVADALRSLSQLVGINLMLSQGIQGQVTILFSEVTIEEAFNTLLTSYNLSFSWEGNILSIFLKSDAPVMTRIFAIQHTNAADIKPIIDKMLNQGKGTCEVDARTNSLMITDTSAKLSEIRNLLPQLDVKESTVDVSSRPITEVYYLNYADASTLKAPIQMLSSAVQIQEFSSSQASQAGAAGGGTTVGRMDMMIITDTQNNLNRIRELIEKLDVPPVQVTIDAHIYEIDKNEEEKLGVNWQKSIPIAGTTANLLDISITPETSDAGGTGVFRFGSLDINQFSALLAMLKTHSFAKVLSNPVITTLNNRQANITVGQAIPYVSASQVNAETGQVTSTVSQANANISLVVTPSVTGNDEVFLDIKPTISSVLGFTELGGNSTPNLSNRSAETQVICKNNHTIVIGGMIKTDKSETMSKVPFLGDLPGLGRFFQKKTSKEVRTELIIFITPHIVHREANRSNLTTMQEQQSYSSPRLTLQP